MGRIWNSPIIRKLTSLQGSEEILESRFLREISLLERQVRSMPDSGEKRTAEHKLAELHKRLSDEAKKAASLHLAEERRLSKYR